ncbi:hypothetical protein CR513_42332, partial [Mucuna pruriens]
MLIERQNIFFLNWDWTLYTSAYIINLPSVVTLQDDIYDKLFVNLLIDEMVKLNDKMRQCK